MADTWLSEDFEDSAEDYEDSEAFDGGDYDSADAEDIDDAEASRRERRQQARRRAARRKKQVVMRRRAAQARARSRRTAMVPARTQPVKAAVRQTQAQVNDLALESQVQADEVSRALTAYRKSIGSTQLALAGSLITGQLVDSLSPNISFLQNNVAKAAVKASPALFLRRPGKSNGVVGTLTHPAVLTAAGVGGALLIGELTKDRGNEVDRLEITLGRNVLVVDEKTRVAARAVDKNGRTVEGVAITFTSDAPDIVSVDSATGEVKALRAGGTEIVATATVNGKTFTAFAGVQVLAYGAGADGTGKLAKPAEVAT
jgi:hypothetical protein